MASDMKKPLGITVLRIRDVKEKLKDVSVSDIFGLGKKTYPLLIDKGIKTIGDFMDPNNKDLIVSVISETSYHHYMDHLSGKSSNVVDPYRYSDPESISHSMTYDRSLTNSSEILDEILKMSDDLHEDLKKYCSMYDYRSGGGKADWGTSKDSVERAIAFLNGRSYNQE